MIVNLTPHTMSIYNEAGDLVTSVPPSGTVARVTTSRTLVGEIGGVPLYNTTYGTPTDLPDATDGVIYIVSGLFRAAVPDRTDVWQPGELLRNEAGQPIGCIGLSR